MTHGIGENSSNGSVFEASVDSVLGNIRNLLVKKHHDYGNLNLKKFGTYGIMVRMSDKMSRLENLMSIERKMVDETIEDTFLDLAGYAVQGLRIIENERERERLQNE